METCDHEPCTQPTTTTTTNTSAFNDTGSLGDKNWIQQVLAGLSYSFPLNYTCYHYTAVGNYCTLCVQIVWLVNGANWREAPWELGLFTFWLWSGHCIQLALTSTAMIQIYILGATLMSFKKTYFNLIFWIILQLGLQKACWSQQVERGIIYSRPYLIWNTQSDWLIFFSQKRFHWLTRSTGLNNPVLSESTESSDNVQLTICTPVLQYSTWASAGDSLGSGHYCFHVFGWWWYLKGISLSIGGGIQTINEISLDTALFGKL